MTTKFMGVREFRQNITGLYKDACKKNTRYIVLKKNRPVLEVKVLSKKEASLEALIASVAEAEADIKAGRVYTWEQVKNEFGL